MSVIIRLQNLPWAATAHDIRQYFHGLSIPEGGVHIVGGEKGDAFIAFSTDEDARQAFNRSTGKIKDAPISLLLSSRTEMQKVIEAARSRAMAALMGGGTTQPSIVPIMPTAVPAATAAAAAAAAAASALSAFRGTKKSSSAGAAGETSSSRRRSRSRSSSRSSDRYERRERRRDRSRSGSRERTRERRRRSRTRSRSRSRSRSRERRSKRSGAPASATTPAAAAHRVGVWENPPPANVFANPADSANLLATFVANNILPNILNGNGSVNQLAAIAGLQEQLQLQVVKPPPVAVVESNNGQTTSGGNALLVQPNHCIKLFPFFGGVGDIEQFFAKSELAEDGVRFSKDIFGNRNGQIYVNFAYARCKEEALSRHGERIRNQIVAIEHVGADEFAKMYLNPKNVLIPGEDGGRACVHLRIAALPNFADAQDVRKIFDAHAVVAVVIAAKGRVKVAYVQFASAQAAAGALADIKCHQFEGKPIAVVACADGEFEEAARAHGVDALAEPPTRVIAMSGLPLKCSDTDIVDFFSDVGVMPAKIHMVPNEAGFVDGAVCEFYGVDDAILGFQKNGTLFGTSTVSMKYEPVNEGPPKKMGTPGPPAPMAQQQQQQQQQQYPHRQLLPHGMNMNHHPPRGGHPNRSFFPNPNQYSGPPVRGPRSQNMSMPPMNDLGRGMPAMRRFPHAHPPQPQLDYDDGICGDDEVLAPPGCVLLMENVPYKAGVEEILNFLGSYNVSGENVLRKYNANGMPSGEAKIIFDSPDEVYHIIQQNRGRRIRERIIHMAQI